MLRVVMLSWEYPPRIVGGISPHVYELSQQLAAQGVQVHVVTKATPNVPDEEIEPSGVHVHRVHLQKDPNDFIHEIQLLNQATDLRVRQLLEDWRPGGQPTLFHAHDWLSLDAARELKYEYQLPIVATLHATEMGRNNGIHNDMQGYIHEQEYWLSYEAWKVIVCSQFMKDEVTRAFSCPADKVEVIFNGIDPQKFEFEWPEEEQVTYRAQYAQPNEKIVIYVGRFVREKGIHVLLNAASAILAQEPKVKFLIVGGGHRERLEKFVRWYGLEQKILFTGFMASHPLWQLYRVADVAVFPSLYEPFGIVALEGMAAGVAVVASDAGGLREVVIHDQTGTSSYAGDAESLAFAVLRVLKEPDRAKQLKKAARRRLDTDFNWKLLAEKTIHLYEQAWAEFLQSYWAEGTLWPISPGADDRAKRLGVREKASIGGFQPRPPRAVTMPAPDTSALRTLVETDEPEQAVDFEEES